MVLTEEVPVSGALDGLLMADLRLPPSGEDGQKEQLTMAENPLFTPPRTILRACPDGSVLLSSAQQPGDCPDTVVHSLRIWAMRQPYRPLIAERDTLGKWRSCSYGEAAYMADAIGEALLRRGLGSDRPLLILSGNSINHLLMTLGAMTAGIPVAPVNLDCSVRTRDHGRLEAIADFIRPGAVFAEDASRFASALDALTWVPAIIGSGRRAGASRLRSLLATRPGSRVARAFAELGPGSLAKILFESGPAGELKGVLTTHRMLSANQQMMRQAWAFLHDEPPQIVDWLPWSYAFGGSHNVNMALTNGGTMYIDAGYPAPGRFAQTIANLTDVPPTIYFNIPEGYAQLIPALESDKAFAARFFSRLRLAFTATVTLTDELRGRFREVAVRTTGREVPVTGSWGMPETGPAVTTANFDYDDARCIGAPLPGTELKLVPAQGAYEMRMKGPNVTPGYFRRADLTAAAFDEDGFYRSGAAVTLTDLCDPDAGLLLTAPELGPGLGHRVAADPCGDRRDDHPFGVEPVEDGLQSASFLPAEPVGAHLHVVEEHRELQVGRLQGHRDGLPGEAGRVGVH
jgi:feruloyl-CoA synthase